VPVAPALKRLGLLLDDLETRGLEPLGHVVPPRIEVIASDVALDDLAPDDREPAGTQVCERFLEVGLRDLLDGQVEVPTRAQRPAQVGQDRRPIPGNTFSIASTVIAASNSSSKTSSWRPT